MRPVSAEFDISQAFASMPTAGVVGNIRATGTVAYYVAMYGDYQPFGHAGLDVACPVGTPVHAIHSGTVVWCDWDVNLPGGPYDWYSRWFFYQRFGGRILLIKTFYGHIHAYAHLSEFKVGYGQVVKEGQLIALSGDSAAGQDQGVAPHLHVEKIVDFNYTTGGGLIYGRTDPAPDFGTFAPMSAAIEAAPVKESEMPTFTRIGAINRKAGATELGAGKTWYLKDKNGKVNLNLASGTGGLGAYDVDLFLQGTGLPAGESISVQFLLVEGSKRSSYFTQKIHGSKDGAFRGNARFKMPILKAARLEVAVTSTVAGPDLTTYGADVYVWQ
jgi:hypothetical protein